MKRSLLVLVICSIWVLGQTKPWKDYGKGTMLKTATSLKDIVAEVKKYEGKDLLIEGTVKDVCQTKGCWMVVGEGDSEVRVKFEGYSFFVPWDSKGKKVKIQGKIKNEVMNEETAKHQAEEAKKSAEEIARIKGDQTILSLIATGVTMEGGSEFSPAQLEKIKGKEIKEGKK